MSTPIEILDKALRGVCPVHGVSIGAWDDRQTWRIDFKDEATDQEKSAATDILLKFDPTALPVDQRSVSDGELAAILINKGVISQADLTAVAATAIQP